MLEERVALLSKLTTTVAGLTAQHGQEKHEVKCEFPESSKSESESSDSESESSDSESESSDSESECDFVCDVTNHVECPVFKNVFLSMPVQEEPMNIVELPSEKITEVLSEVLESLEVDVNLPKRKVSEDDVKTLVVNLDYDSMSVKELKDRVADMGGPKLKTKKELVEFLKNKI